MPTETILLNKYIKKRFPFIMEVSDFYLQKNKLVIYAVVSPSHFCELFLHDDINREVNTILKKEFTTMIKSIITEWDENDIQFTYFPDLKEELSVLDCLNNKES
jgi:hypothetical protein